MKHIKNIDHHSVSAESAVLREKSHTENNNKVNVKSKIRCFKYRLGVLLAPVTMLMTLASPGCICAADGDALYIDENGTVKVGSALEVNGRLRARSIESKNPYRYRMYPADPIVYLDIFEARDKSVIAKLGNPKEYDEATHKSYLWFGRTMIQYGGNDEVDGNGAVINIPKGYDTVWVRICGDRYNFIHAYFTDGDKKDLGVWAGGLRSSNTLSPDGSLSDGCIPTDKDLSNLSVPQWLPIPAGRSGQLVVVSNNQTTYGFWISGLAFSKNPWAHAAQSVTGFTSNVNGGETADILPFFHNNVLGGIKGETNLELKVPVVPTGRDKLLYLIEYNNDTNGCMHTNISVNGQNIERFLSTYDNPFARHWNSKSFHRYIAARIPANLINNNDRWLTVRIDMKNQIGKVDYIHFYEIGTHDLEVPYDDALKYNHR